MHRHYTIRVHAHNEHAVLQRILMAFSRRRLRIQAMQFFDLEPGRPADMQFDLDCAPHHARDLLAQIRAVVEVQQVWVEERSLEEPRTDGARLAAA